MHPCQGLGSERKTQEIEGKQEKELQQAWGTYLAEKVDEKALKKRKNQRKEELLAFENMSVLDSDEESNNVNTNEEGEIWNWAQM